MAGGTETSARWRGTLGSPPKKKKEEEEEEEEEGPLAAAGGGIMAAGKTLSERGGGPVTPGPSKEDLQRHIKLIELRRTLMGR